MSSKYLWLAGLASALSLAACPSAPVAPAPEPAPAPTPTPAPPPAPAPAPAPEPARLPPPPRDEGPPLVAGGAAIRPPLERVTLDNGLDVYLLPDAGAPLVCVQVWVKVGSVDEHEGKGAQAGITGLSHFFEHLMFQGTERYPNYDLALAPLGARNNAFTYQDATVYWAYTPKEHLAKILDIEADRFEHMKVDFVHLEPEREVVKSERRQRVDADPAEIAEERAIKRTFDRFPYRWGPIGWMDDLDAIPLETAQRYHAEHYTTTGTYLVIAGDFDAKAALAYVRQTWGKLPRPATAPTFQRRSETLAVTEDWVGPRHDHIVRQTSQPIVYWSYRSPAPGGATLRDYAALELVDYALTGGKSGRLAKKLVFTDMPKVSNLWARLTPLRHPAAYVWRADLLPNVTTAEVEAALDAELATIAKEGLAEAELAQAVASLRADAVRTNLSNSDKAETIGMSIASTGSPFALHERLEAYPTITQQEIKDAVARYLVPERRVRVVVVSPDRIAELAVRFGKVDPAAVPLVPVLERAAGLFARALELRDQRAEADRESRAIAMLIQRGEDAIAAARTRADKRAIRDYLDKNEMGSRARAARLTAQEVALQAAEAELKAEQHKLLAEVEATMQVSRMNFGDLPQTLAVMMLGTSLRDATALPGVPAGLARDLSGARQLALQTLAAFVYEARGLAKSAQEARQWVLEQGPKLLATKLDPDAKALAEDALALARDTDVKNLPVVDAPTTPLVPTTRELVP